MSVVESGPILVKKGHKTPLVWVSSEVDHLERGYKHQPTIGWPIRLATPPFISLTGSDRIWCLHRRPGSYSCQPKTRAPNEHH